MKKIVVTGALGHIGSRFIRDIPVMFPGCEVVMVDNLSTQRYGPLFNLPNDGKYRFLERDVLTAALEPLFDKADVVVHLAAITDATNSFQNKEQVEAVNFGGAERVARACVNTGSPMIFLSTTSVYGSQSTQVDESCGEEDLKPQSPYADAKLKAEKMLQALGLSAGLRFSICRFGTIFGVSKGMRFHTVVNKFCWQAVMGEPLTVWTTAMHQKRPYLDLEDAIEAMSFIVRTGLFDRGIYNILTENLTVEAIVQTIRTSIPHLKVKYVDSPIMNQLSYEVSNGRFKSRGFVFRGNLGRGVRETIELLKGAQSAL